jgi:glycosyltransferase involved in cell wall biosynthesis
MSSTFSPLVSIITPTYNHEKYVGDCIDSVLNQTYENWEQIILDDGSTDRTAEVVRNHSDSRVRYVYQKNAGIAALAHTYNRALEHCRGPIIAILEGDDTWPPYKLAAMTTAFSDPTVVLAYGQMREMDPTGNVAKRVGRTARRYGGIPRSVLFNDPVRAAVPYLLTVPGHSMVPASTVLIRRTALDLIGGFQHVGGQLYTDFPTFIMLAVQGKFYFFPDVMGYRRMHVSSATARFAEEMTERSRKHLAELLEKPEFQLSADELRRVHESWRFVAAGGNFQRGRILLLEQKWPEARRSFLEAIHLDDIPMTLAAITGWCASWFHYDLENLYRWAGRPMIRTDC